MPRQAPLSKSHTRSILSQLPETARRPSGVTLTLSTQSVWPSRMRMHAPFVRSQTFTVLSQPPVKARSPSHVALTHSTVSRAPACVAGIPSAAHTPWRTRGPRSACLFLKRAAKAARLRFQRGHSFCRRLPLQDRDEGSRRRPPLSQFPTKPGPCSIPDALRMITSPEAVPRPIVFPRWAHFTVLTSACAGMRALPAFQFHTGYPSDSPRHVRAKAVTFFTLPVAV